MAILSDRHQPSFTMWPLQNSRTAYQPACLPAILTVPHRRYRDGTPVADSSVSDVTFRIEEAPGRVPVAGHQYRGIFIPDLERFSITLNSLELSSYIINVKAQRFEKPSGTEIVWEDAEDGDFMVYVTEKDGLQDKIRYYTDADYYDLSSVCIATSDLRPLGKYIISWCAHYYRRVLTSNEELYCIDTSINRLARHAVIFDHPGDAHQEMLEKTPAFAFKDEFGIDDTAKFYRPFADAVQDIFDESSFLETINHIDHVPANLIPYLSHLVGWDLPYFPGATDQMRRRTLEKARHLQALKGSKRAIRELFDIFGYTAEIINLWYRTDGAGFVAPDENSGDPTNNITSETVCRAEPLISNGVSVGFGSENIPLLYRPLANITVEGWIVKTSSPVYDALLGISDSLDDLEGGVCFTDQEGYQLSTMLHEQIPTGPIVGYSKVLISQKVNGTKSTQIGFGPVNEHGVTYNDFYNQLGITYDRFLSPEPDEKIFLFATYEREKFIIPDSLEDLRSNRFDIEVLEKAHGADVDPHVLAFLIEFVYKLKAFHSLLRKIIFTTELTDVYNVTDFCLGGDSSQREGTDAGEAQVPPAIIPTTDTEVSCSDESYQRNFKDSDFEYRDDVIGGLEREFLAWKSLDGKYALSEGDRAIYESLSRVEIPEPADDDCEYNYLGQDRKVSDPELDEDHDVDDRGTHCDISTSSADYCYEGRVKDELALGLTIPLTEQTHCKPCSLGLGVGYYYTFSYVPHNWGELDYDDINQIRRSWLSGLMIKVLGWPASLRYSDRRELDDNNLNDNHVAIRRPSLGIEKDNLFYPGHRFVRIGALESDFTSTEWTKRPWDDVRHCVGDTYMEYDIIVDTNGDEQIDYDPSIPLTYVGNSLSPDISSLGDHDLGSEEYFVTHSIFTSTPYDEMAELAQVVYTEELEPTGGVDPISICIPAEIGLMFQSAIVEDAEYCGSQAEDDDVTGMDEE